MKTTAAGERFGELWEEKVFSRAGEATMAPFVVRAKRGWASALTPPDFLAQGGCELNSGGFVGFTMNVRDGLIYRMESLDEARTWSAPQPVQPPLWMGGGALAAKVLANGHVALVFNNNQPDLPTSRSPLTIALSMDDGRTFPAMKVRATRRRGRGWAVGDRLLLLLLRPWVGARCAPVQDLELYFNREEVYAQPDISQDSEGRIHVMFSTRNYTAIRHVVFPEDWVVRLDQEWPPPLTVGVTKPEWGAWGSFVTKNAAAFGFTEPQLQTVSDSARARARARARVASDRVPRRAARRSATHGRPPVQCKPARSLCRAAGSTA
eukprot:scaffold4287_cov285-Prasinococcus_capsulatus_cf.AAC.2